MLALTTVLAGCEVRDAASLAPEALAPSGPESYVSVSEELPEVGSTVTIAGNADRAHGAMAFGSYRAHLVYDPSRLEFVGEVSLPGAMRAMNATSGRVTVAGAAANGLPDGKLFAAHFRVLRALPFESLALVVDELNAMDYSSQVRTLTAREARKLDRSLR